MITVDIEVRPRRNRRGEVSTNIPQQNPLYSQQKLEALAPRTAGGNGA